MADEEAPVASHPIADLDPDTPGSPPAAPEEAPAGEATPMAATAAQQAPTDEAATLATTAAQQATLEGQLKAAGVRRPSHK